MKKNIYAGLATILLCSCATKINNNSDINNISEVEEVNILSENIIEPTSEKNNIIDNNIILLKEVKESNNIQNNDFQNSFQSDLEKKFKDQYYNLNNEQIKTNLFHNVEQEIILNTWFKNTDIQKDYVFYAKPFFEGLQQYVNLTFKEKEEKELNNLHQKQKNEKQSQILESFNNTTSEFRSEVAQLYNFTLNYDLSLLKEGRNNIFKNLNYSLDKKSNIDDFINTKITILNNENKPLTITELKSLDIENLAVNLRQCFSLKPEDKDFFNIVFLGYNRTIYLDYAQNIIDTKKIKNVGDKERRAIRDEYENKFIKEYYLKTLTVHNKDIDCDKVNQNFQNLRLTTTYQK